MFHLFFIFVIESCPTKQLKDAINIEVNPSTKEQMKYRITVTQKPD